MRWISAIAEALALLIPVTAKAIKGEKKPSKKSTKPLRNVGDWSLRAKRRARETREYQRKHWGVGKKK